MQGPEYALPISIGDDVWVGGGAIILPGVSVGSGCEWVYRVVKLMERDGIGRHKGGMWVGADQTRPGKGRAGQICQSAPLPPYEPYCMYLAGPTSHDA